ncbi:MAG: hypothetical protein ACM3UZ_04710 [Acidobacteriota bacterium]
MSLLKKSIVLILMCATLSCLLGLPTALASGHTKPKIVILVLDNLALKDLNDPELKNIQRLLPLSGLGLMNDRTGSRVSSDRASAFLSLGMGARVKIPDNSPEAFDSPEGTVKSREVTHLRMKVQDQYPNHMFGRIGENANKTGLRVSVIGNADTDQPHRELLLFAQDAKGTTDSGNVSENLIVADKESPWVYSANIDQMVSDAKMLIPQNDIVFIDFGDTSRAAEALKAGKIDQKGYLALKARALHKADQFIGMLLPIIDANASQLMIISPMTAPEDINAGNTALSPLIMYDTSHEPGILSSSSTKRDGLVLNMDIAPSILGHFGIINNELASGPIKIIPQKNNYQAVTALTEQYVKLHWCRFIVHGIFGVLLGLILLALYLSMFKNRSILNTWLLRAIGIFLTALVPVSFILFAIFPGIYYWNVVLTVGLAALIAISFAQKRKWTLTSVLISSLLTAMFLLIALLFDTSIMHATPLGYLDVIAGGRFYGINNDCMGILLGSAMLSWFYTLHRFKMPKSIQVVLTLIVGAVLVISQTPPLGANVGGTIAALATGIFAVVSLTTDRPLSSLQIAGTVFAAFIIELSIAYFDYRAGNSTHAGKTIAGMINGRVVTQIYEILVMKLSLFGLMLLIPPWNIIFFSEVWLLFKGGTDPAIAGKLNRKMPAVRQTAEVVFWGALVAFFFNDTGIIAAAFMLAYIMIPLAITHEDNQGNTLTKPI